MKVAVPVLLFIASLPIQAALNVQLTVEEALIPGGSPGIARTNEPFCTGVPISDSAAITSTNNLGLAGASAGQFRILGRWPSGNAKWIKVCGIIPSLSAGGTVTVTLTDSGIGDFGGAALASGSSPIRVATGTADFTIKQGRFNVIDTATIGSTSILESSSSSMRGLLLRGPSATGAFPENVTCTGGNCTNLYSSANDPNSACTIEENGPVMAVIRCVGNHMDQSGNAYMQYTAREHFYKGKNWVKVTSVLRNANYDTVQDSAGNTFNTAYKGIRSYELALSPSIGGTLNYTIATDAGSQTGTLNQAGGADSAYVYQGQTEQMATHYCPYQSGCANKYTSDTGFRVVRNGVTVSSGNSKQSPQGWADISDSSGKGLQIGIYQMAAYWPKSLEFNAGGADVRIGIWPQQNSQPFYQAWPAWSIHDLFLGFHASAPASHSDEFLKFQHYLVARADVSYYNASEVFPYKMPTAAQEDSFYQAAGKTATPTISSTNFCYSAETGCIPDYSVNGATLVPISVYRTHFWPDGGPSNQEEFRWSNLQVFLKRGFTGRYLDAAHFYRFLAEKGLPHADGTSASDPTVNSFTWRSKRRANQANAELDGLGQPKMESANRTLADVAWVTSDPLHAHWYGMPDYYFLTGDETIREAMVPMKDYFLNDNTYQNVASNSGLPTRAVGIHMMGAARFSEYLAAIADPDSGAVLAQGERQFESYVKPDLCVSGWPSGCTPPTTEYTPGTYDPPGISRVRGLHLASGGRATRHCGEDHLYRALTPFQGSLLIEGILALRRAKGAAWSDHQLALDLAYGVSQWALSEAFSDDGQPHWYVAGGQLANQSLYNGFRYGVYADVPLACPGGTAVGRDTVSIGGTVYNDSALATPHQGMWMHFYLHALTNGTLSGDEQRKLQIAMARVASQGPNGRAADWGQYQLASIIAALSDPSRSTLQDVPFTVREDGNGVYTLTWMVPAGAQSYRIKWSPKIIAPSSALLQFDPVVTNSFGLDPAKYATWFGANNVAAPAPGTAGTSQSVSIAAGAAGLAAPNFSVKAYIPGPGGGGGTGPAATLAAVNGNNQSGTVGKPLPAPLTVKVGDASGNPVAGIPVIFAVSAGGGTLSATQVATNSQGLAATTLTLGPAAGANIVTASSGSLLGSPVTFSATGVSSGSGQAVNLTVVSGNGQTGLLGQILPAPFTVKVSDAAGGPVAGTKVTFAVTSGGGAVSVTEVATNSQGLASTTLTLGPAAGTNIVTAASGTLAGSPVTFTATAGSPQAQAPQVTWVRQSEAPGWPGFAGYLTPRYDPVSQSTAVYGIVKGSQSIYSTDLFFYSAESNTFTHLPGTRSMYNSCPPDTSTWPGDRHPVAQTAVDTKRNRLWMYGGLNATCNGGTAPNTSPRQDMYYLQLNASPAANTWHQVFPENLPQCNGSCAMVYVPDDDVLFVFGSDGSAQTRDNYVYCPAFDNPTPGTLTDKQVAAGCARPDDWTHLPMDYGTVKTNGTSVTLQSGRPFVTDGSWNGAPVVIGGGVYLIATVTDSNNLTLQSSAGIGSGYNYGVQPPGSASPGLVYDPVTKKVIQFGGMTGGGIPQNDTWAYDVATQTWSKRCLGECVPPPVWSGSPSVGGKANAQPAMAYIPTTGKILYHQTNNSGAPADWEYDPAMDRWTKLSSVGGGPSVVDSVMAYDASKNVLVSWSYNGPVPDIWQGFLSDAPLQACDLNEDRAINVLDVELAVSQATGAAACGSADFTGDGACTDADVTRVVSAALGEACRVGP